MGGGGAGVSVAADLLVHFCCGPKLPCFRSRASTLLNLQADGEKQERNKKRLGEATPDLHGKEEKKPDRPIPVSIEPDLAFSP